MLGRGRWVVRLTNGVLLRTLIASLVVLSLSLVPVAPAAGPAASPVLDLYFKSDGLTTDPPTAATSSTKTLSDDDPAGFNAPAAPVFIGGGALLYTWGTYKFTEDVTITQIGVATVFVTADTAALIDDIGVYVYKGTSTTSTASGGRGFYADSSTSAPLGTNTLANGKVLKFEIPLAGLLGSKWKKDDVLSVALAVSALTVEGTPTDVKLAFGSAKHPSRISFAVDHVPASAKSEASLTSFYLGDKSLQSDAPIAEVVLKRQTESKEPNSGLGPASAGSSSAWSWGKVTLGQPLKAAGECLVVVYIGLGESPSAAAMRGLRAVILLTPPGATAAIQRQQDIGIRPTAFQSASAVAAPTRFALAVNMTGIDVPAGTSFELQFLTWSTSDTPGKLFVHYGAKTTPSAVHFIASGSGAAPPASSSPTSTTATTSSSAGQTSSSAAVTSTSVATNGSGTNDTAGAETAGAKDASPPGKLPGVGVWAAIAVLACVAVLARRRT